jgi:hypothetical protein
MDRVRITTGAVIATVAAGCMTPPETPSMIREVDGDYAKIAACAYQRLDRKFPTQVRFVDLRGSNMARIYHELETSRQWEASLMAVAPNRTRIEIRETPMVYGPDLYAQIVMAEVSPCLQT